MLTLLLFLLGCCGIYAELDRGSAQNSVILGISRNSFVLGSTRLRSNQNENREHFLAGKLHDLVSRKVDEGPGCLGSSVTPSSISEGREPEILSRDNHFIEVPANQIATRNLVSQFALVGGSDDFREVQTFREDPSITNLKTEFGKIAELVRALQKSNEALQKSNETTHKDIVALRESNETTHKEIVTLRADTDMLVLDVAMIMAGQLLSRVLGHTGFYRPTYPCSNAIKNQGVQDHWGQNFVKMMENNFARDLQEQKNLASAWDSVLNQRNNVAHPDLDNDFDYIEAKASKLIAIMERSPPKAGSIDAWALGILKDRYIFLTATPCPDTRS